MENVAAIIAAIGGVVTAIGVILIGYWSYRAKERASAAVDATKANEAKIVEIGGSVYNLGQRVDGRLSELLEAGKQAARAEGVAQGEQSQRDRSSASDKGPSEVTVINDPEAPVPTWIVGDKP